MRNRFLPVVIFTAALGVAALAGYLVPRKTPEAPVRLMLANPGGAVVFTHQVHADRYGDPCMACHHKEKAKTDAPVPCGACHPAAFDENFKEAHMDAFPDKTLCDSCHHAEPARLKFDHDVHATEYAADDCQTCHHEPSIEPEPTKCSSCHKDVEKDRFPNLKTAAHARCGSCHEDLYANGMVGCGSCHEFKAPEPGGPYPDCGLCHKKPVEDIVPVTVKAFHGQCMGCHRKKGRGPFGNDSCNRCHLR